MTEETIGSQALEFLNQILNTMQFDAHPELVSETDEEVNLTISGESEDIGRLIGRHGQTLDALQYIVSIAINRRADQRCRILLDAEGYRGRHQQALEEKVLQIAEQAKLTGEEAVLEPQSPRDRRIVHMILADDPNIVTYSEGEGDSRRVVISPKK